LAAAALVPVSHDAAAFRGYRVRGPSGHFSLKVFNHIFED
jgi:hypothetical protein